MSKKTTKPVVVDAELQQFMDDLEESIAQAKRGEFAALHTPAQIKARRGRPLGSVQATTKQAMTLRLDADVLARWRASGKGWQTKMAAILTAAAP